MPEIKKNYYNDSVACKKAKLVKPSAQAESLAIFLILAIFLKENDESPERKFKNTEFKVIKE